MLDGVTTLMYIVVTPLETVMIVCSKCKNEKTGSHVSYCKPCYNAWKRERYAANREKEVQRVMDYNKRNYEKFLENLARYRQGESYKKSRLLWQEKNKDAVSFYDMNKRSKRKAAKFGHENFSKQQLDDLFKKYKDSCAYCGCKGKLTVDHIVPLSKGGKHELINLAPACSGCNGRKHAKNEIVFRQKNGQLL